MIGVGDDSTCENPRELLDEIVQSQPYYDMSGHSLTPSLVSAMMSYVVRVVVSEKLEGKTYHKSSGTGLLLPGGYVLTNSHVVEDACASQMSVFLTKPLNKRTVAHPEFPISTIVKSDETLDLALLKILSPSVPQGYHSLAGVHYGLGTFVMGFGFPFGTNRMSEMQTHITYFADNTVDVASGVDLGFSGAPLFAIDMGNPRLVGIVTAKYLNTEGRGMAMSLEALTTFAQGTPIYQTLCIQASQDICKRYLTPQPQQEPLAVDPDYFLRSLDENASFQGPITSTASATK